MKHQNRKGRKFSREVSVRKALLRSLAASLIMHERITTTAARAKELSRIVEPYVTRARVDTIASRRILARSLPPRVVSKLFGTIAPKYKDRAGGYTRVTKVGRRGHDAAALAQIEFVK